MELIGFFSIWYELGRWRQIRKYMVRISATIVCQKIPEWEPWVMVVQTILVCTGYFPHRLMQKRIGMRWMEDYVVESRPCSVAPMQQKSLTTNLSSSLVMMSSGKMALLLQWVGFPPMAGGASTFMCARYLVWCLVSSDRSPSGKSHS